MPVEFENGIKSAVFASHLHDAGRISKFCRQNFVSVSKTAKFVILPASCKHALPVEFYTAFVTRLIFIMLLIVLIVVLVLSILIKDPLLTMILRGAKVDFRII